MAYQHGNWYCKPATEAEAREIVERAVASGAVNKEGWKGNSTRNTYGVTNGCVVSGESIGTKYTIEELRKKFPLPGDRSESVPLPGRIYYRKNGKWYPSTDNGQVDDYALVHTEVTGNDEPGQTNTEWSVKASIIEQGYFDSDGCVVIEQVDSDGEGWVGGVEVILRSEFPFFESVDEDTDPVQSQITSLYTVGRVLKPYGDHIGYSIIVHMSDSHATLLTDFGNFVEVTIKELHGFQMVGLFVGPTWVDAIPPQNPLDRLKDQLDNLNHAKKVLIDLGFV